MTKPYRDLTGMRIGKLVAIKLHVEKGKRTQWLCRCDCGNEKLIPLSSITSGRVKSCGCYRKQVTSNNFKKHGMTNEQLYQTWSNMKSRCNNPNRNCYKNYGGRGIKMCSEWLTNFETFKKWALENGYQPNLTIERIDVNGDYEPSNCKWCDWTEQANNTRKNVFTTIEGEKRTLAEHARYYGVNYFTLHHRYSNGLRGMELLKRKKEKTYVDFRGETKTLQEWRKKLGFERGTLEYRYHHMGLRGNELFRPIDLTKSRKTGGIKL